MFKKNLNRILVIYKIFLSYIIWQKQLICKLEKPLAFDTQSATSPEAFVSM